MQKNMDFGFYGKGIDGYVQYSLAANRIWAGEEKHKALMNEFDENMDECDTDAFDAGNFGSDDF